MSCPDPETLLEFVDGGLIGQAAARFEEHLDCCGGCRELVACAARQDGPRSPGSTDSLGQAAAPPIGELVHYRLEGVISQGGHGIVWRARDLRLDRLVALKQARLGDPRASARFAREMRITARLQHPSIVTLHEAGVSGAGEQFYTMELVSGPTLLERIGQARDLRARLALLPHAIAIAEALAYAHDRRIIHRDLKPANVIVGSFGETVILDWGLAKDLSASEPDDEPGSEDPSPGATSAGTVLGTPSYMPPEQAAGQAADERSDVYALGAILYQVLTGEPPYAGVTSAEVLQKIGSEDAVSVEKRQPGVPQDLAAIVRRAMARAPQGRYATAKELAADLKKFATGELVSAHRYRSSELVSNWVRRHRRIVASALAVGAALGLWLRSALGAREEARLAQQFAQQAEAIESTLRIAELLPLHDLRGERAGVRARMTSVEAKLGQLGAFAEGPGRYALGRAALALHDPGAARAQLEKALAAGDRSPEVAQALGQALGEQYRAALEEAEGTESETARQDRRKTAERELRDPALQHLREGRAATTGRPLLTEALIALYEGRHEDALAGAEAEERREPSLYEAARLAGDTCTRMSIERRQRGDAEGAHLIAARARGAYARAVAIARSDEAGYLGQCELELQIMTLHADRGQPVEEEAAAGLAACDQALAVNPDSARAFNQKAAIHGLRAQQQGLQGIDPRPLLQLSIKMASEALRRDPASFLAHYNIGSAWNKQGRVWEWRHGIDPRPSLALAIESYVRAIAIRPTSRTLVSLCNSHSTFGLYEAKHGGEPQQHWARAEESCRRASALDPRFADARNALGLVLENRAERELARGIDPRASVASAVEALRKAIELQPGFAAAHNNVGVSMWMRAAWERAQGIDCSAAALESVRSYREALALMPTYANGYVNVSMSYRLLAQQQLDRGLDPSAALGDARAALDAGLKHNGKDHLNFLSRGRIELLTARHAWPGPAARAPLAAALAAVATALELNPKDADGPQLEAEIHSLHAEWLLARHEGAGGEIQRGLSAAARALELDPKLGEAIAVRGALLRQKARVEPDSQLRAALDAEGQAELRRAREANPLLSRDYPP